MSSFDLETCDIEDFVAEATPQSGSLEEAASTQEILIQQIEGYLSRMRAAMCADLETIRATCCDVTPASGELWKISERRAEATTAITTGGSNLPINFEVAGINDAPGELTWDAVAFAWENISSATLYCDILVSISCQDSGGGGRPQFEIQRDIGAGFVAEPGGVFWSEVGRMGTGKVLRVDLAPGDKIAVTGRAIVGTVNMILDSSFQLLSRTTAV